MGDGRRGEARDRSEPDPLIGEVLASRYQLEHQLGEGAMGAVYRARHVKVGRAFAVKVLHKRLLDDAKVSERFDREAELAGRLRHANVIGVVDVGDIHGRRYMVMDFAEGMDLAALLNEAPMAAPRVTNLARQLLEGLYHAHEQGLIHRDFKPENVIVERDDHGEEVPRIVDFGIAILREAGESAASPGRLTTNGLVLGTPHYMAPEQAVADPIDHRIDLFALGIIIYEMLCGKLPFDGTGAEIARANLLLDPPPISQRVPFLEVDPLLEAFSRRLMAKRRDQRPPTAKAARELLDRITLDPEAAAKELGVSLAARAPAVTAPVRPLTSPQPGSGPVRAALVTPPQAPPMQSSLAVVDESAPAPDDAAAMPPPAARGMPTEMASPLAWQGDADGDDALAPKPRGRGALYAALAALALLGGVGAIVALTHHGDEPATPPTATPIAMEVTPAPAPTAPTPAPADPVPAPVDPPPVIAQRPIVPPTLPQPAHVATAPHAQLLRPSPTAAIDTARPTAVPPPTAVPTPSVDVSSGQLAKLYSDVGDELAKLQQAKGIDAARDLWTRYRRIRLGTAMLEAAPQRAETAAILVKIRRDALVAK